MLVCEVEKFPELTSAGYVSARACIGVAVSETRSALPSTFSTRAFHCKRSGVLNKSVSVRRAWDR